MLRKQSFYFYLSLLWVYFIFPSAYGAVYVAGSLTNEKIATSGMQYSGAIKVQNTGKTTQQIRVIAKEYSFNSQGKTSYNDVGGKANAPRSNASWIRFSPEQTSIPAQSSAVINFTVDVPNRDSLSGTYWSVLMIQPISKNSLLAPKATKNPGVSVNHVVQYAYQIVTHIGNSGKATLKFQNPQYNKQQNKRFMKLDILNEGTRWAKTEVFVDVFSQDGKALGRFKGDRKRLFPGTSAKFKVDISKLSVGEYRGLLTADAGENDVYGTEINLSVH